MKFRIHPSYEPPDIEIEGKYVGTGKKVYTVLNLQDENMLPNPWGACDPAKEKNVKLKFYSQYTRQGCLQECYREKVIDKCTVSENRKKNRQVELHHFVTQKKG